MAVYNFESLREHVGHKVVVVQYGVPGRVPVNVAIECEECCEVLLDFDAPTREERPHDRV